MRFRQTLTIVLGTLVLALAATGAQAQAAAREEGILLQAAQVLEELRSEQDKGIPDSLLDRAYGIAVFPGLVKAAFFFGGRHGDGVFIERNQKGQYTYPFFVSLTGGSFGLQFGGEKEDIVLVFTTRSGAEGVTGGKFTLGGDISVAVGPVGRDATANTDVALAQVYSYSRAKGLFGGVAADGSVLTVDGNSNAAFYRKPGVLASEIAEGAVRSDYEASRRFRRAVLAASYRNHPPANAATAPAPGAAPPPPGSNASPPPASGYNGAPPPPAAAPGPATTGAAPPAPPNKG